MITNNQIKLIKSLQRPKQRQKYQYFIAEGDKIAQEIISRLSDEIYMVCGTSSWIDENRNYSRLLGSRLVEVDLRTMKSISGLRTPSDVLCVLSMHHFHNDLKDKPLRGFSLYLDDVQDPGNVGTLIRVADWFGIPNVIRSEGSADFFNPKVVQSTMGSFLKVNLYQGSSEALIGTDNILYGTFMEGNHYQSVDWNAEGILILGNEGRGIREDLVSNIKYKIAIPGHVDRLAESLNVGIAGGILMAHISTAISKIR